MTKMITFSLWGDNPKYTVGAVRNAELAKEIYPDWHCEFHVAEDVPLNILKQLINLDCSLVYHDKGDWRGMFWRFGAADDPDTTMISRDTDSRLNWREKAAVDYWLEGDKDFHIMRDHPYHDAPILGGMWGARNGVVAGIHQWMKDYEQGDFWQVDQNFLKEIVYPKIQDNVCVHDPYFSRGCPFPVLREGHEDFVGAVYDEKDEFVQC